MNPDDTDVWGHQVSPRIIVIDKQSGERFVVEPPNDHGFLRLRNESGENHHVFEVLDPIDRNRFEIEQQA